MKKIPNFPFPQNKIGPVPNTRDSFHVFIPKEQSVVLGRSNQAESSCHLEQIANDNIKIYKRESGGEAVFLSPKMLIINWQRIGVEFGKFQTLFREISENVQSALELSTGLQLTIRGVSDICVGDKKVLGSGMHWSAGTLHYHAVLNVAESPECIAKYLKHPSREPEYRQGRRHVEFVRSLANFGMKASTNELMGMMETTVLK